jgi:hypothetical protein
VEDTPLALASGVKAAVENVAMLHVVQVDDDEFPGERAGNREAELADVDLTELDVTVSFLLDGLFDEVLETVFCGRSTQAV